MRAAWLYDNHKPRGAEANSAKFLSARAVFDVCASDKTLDQRKHSGDRQLQFDLSLGYEGITMLSSDHAEAKAAFLAKRMPAFAGR
jgi:hypothetical protein